MASEIDVGVTAQNRQYGKTDEITWLLKANPANLGGRIVTVQYYVEQYQGGGNIKVGMFYNTSGNNYKCRSVANLGNPAAGYHSDSVKMAVAAGDLIGFYSYLTVLSADWQGGTPGEWWPGAKGDYCTVGAETTYQTYDSFVTSLYGIGDLLKPVGGLVGLDIVQGGVV